MIMNQSKAMLVAAISFVVTAAALVFVCANAHIDFFPCKKTVADLTRADPFTGKPPLRTEDGTCSLMGHLREPGLAGETEELTGAGWAMLAAFCFGIAAADSALIYVVMSRKAAKTA
jgi:hypothetical protein